MQVIQLGCSGLSYSGGKVGGTSSGTNNKSYNGSNSSWNTPFIGASWIGTAQWNAGQPITNLSAWLHSGGPGGLIVVYGECISGNGSYRSNGDSDSKLYGRRSWRW